MPREFALSLNWKGRLLSVAEIDDTRDYHDLNNWRHGKRRRPMCNLDCTTKGQQAIREAARAMRDTTGNLPLLREGDAGHSDKG
jgi:hypothetical protein